MPNKINGKWVFTDEEIEKQIAQGREEYSEYVRDKPTGTSFHFDPETRTVSIRTTDGRIDFSANKIRELRKATAEDIQQGYITQAGDAIHWDNLDAHYTIAGLAASIFGTREWMKELARKGGQAKSDAKAKASRANGLKGGRPRREPATRVSETAGDLRTTLANADALIASSLDIISVGIAPVNATVDLYFLSNSKPRNPCLSLT